MKKILYIFFVLICCNACKKDRNQDVSEKLLHAVRGGDLPGLYDQQGRYVILRGVNYNVLGDYWAANPAVPPSKAYDKNDFKMMAKYGINCVRLLFSWSKLEPEKGVYDNTYIQKIKQAIEDAAENNIYVLIDMHQDAWGKYIATPAGAACDIPNKGWDGAPQWATITDGESTCTPDGARESAPAVVHAFQNFWDNTDGIQDACVNAWAALVKQTAKYPNVIGYDLLNEPSLGYKEINQEARKLSDFYGRCTQAIRTAEKEANAYEHAIFFEMSVNWNGQPIPFIPFPDFTDDKNIVFAPHTYFEAISDQLTIEQGLDLMNVLSKMYNAGTLIGEFGFFNNPVENAEKYKRYAKKEDAYFMSSTWWQWCQAPGDPHGISWDGTQYDNTSMHLIELDKNAVPTGNINDFLLKILSRSKPLAIHGRPIKLESNPDDGTMLLQANSTQKGTTTLWIPDRFGEPIINGDNVLSADLEKVEGGYNAKVQVTGQYKIQVSF